MQKQAQRRRLPQELPYECLPKVPDAKVHPFLRGELTGSVLVLPFLMKPSHTLQHVQVIKPQGPCQVESIILPARQHAIGGLRLDAVVYTSVVLHKQEPVAGLAQ